jgi:flagellar biosynthesis/type III secretory pathway protein FliH
MRPAFATPMRHPGRSATLRLPDLDAPPPAPPPPGPTLEERLATAFEEGRSAGILEGRERGLEDALRRAEQRIAESLDAVLRLEAASREEAAALAEAGLAELARLALAVLDAAAPLESARAGPDAIIRLADALRPLLDDAPEAALHVAPTPVEAIAARLRGIPVLPDPALPEGDARLAWRDGETALDFSARRRAIREALVSQGLIQMEQDA